MNKIVVGLGFGDEGKGLTTSFLVENSNSDSIVVRHNGGQQAGHTVMYLDKKHVFSQLGSGTLQGLPTYFGSKCTFYPNSFLREYEMLAEYAPKVILNPKVQITTILDIEYNRWLENTRPINTRHGSVGMGFGQTIKRSEEHFHNIYAMDLFYPVVLKAKLANLVDYYKRKGVQAPDDFISTTMDMCRETALRVSIDEDGLLSDYTDVIYETSQGVLLDQHHGFFPNVTRSNTTSKNAMEMSSEFFYDDVEIYYVTRTYQTRHGNGFMSGEGISPVLKNAEEETNKSHNYQGEFRTSNLDVELLRYAIECDRLYSGYDVKRNLVITCNDQLEIDYRKLVYDLEFGDLVKFDNIYLSFGPTLDTIKSLSDLP